MTAVKSRAKSVVGAVFSFPVVLGSLLVLITMFTVRSRFSDPDMWWHLKTGEVIWNTRVIPTVDLFSFTAQGHSWIAQEWLSEVMLYGAWKLGGFTGLMLWFSIVASMLVVGAYILSTIYSGNCKIAFLGGMVVWLFATIGLAIRPHLIGYLILTCELLIIELGRTRSARWLLLLPPLFALWINLHSSYFFGLVLLGVMLVAAFVEFEKGLLVCRRWPSEKRRMLAIAFGLSIAALFVNPIGPKLAWYPLDVMLNQPVNLSVISEWQQTNFGSSRGIALLAIGALTLLIPLIRKVELSASELTVVALGFAFAVIHERMLFLFGIVVAPVLCRLLATSWDRYNPAQDSAPVSGFMLALTVTVIVLSFPGLPELNRQVENANPVKALAFLRRAGLDGRMLNEYVFGGYFIWAAPERKVFIDGRADLYEWAGVLPDYAKWMLVQTDASKFLHKYGISVCLLAKDTPMVRVVSLLPDWKQVYSDEIAVVFVTPQR
jgi:hypothetical protein